MAERKSTRWLGAVLEATGTPVIWGLILSTAFFMALHQKFIDSPMLVRYTAGHPVEYVETALFFIGLVAIALRGWSAVQQFGTLDKITVPTDVQGSVAQRATSLGTQLEQLPAKLASTVYARRLRAALEHLVRSDSAEQLDDELKFQADVEADRMHDGYSLVRIVVWAIPMLGFLGTVIGITMALGDLNPETLVNSPKDAMQGLLSGLGVAFDTTALALSLAMVLMFGQYFTQQVEGQLTAQVDHRATEILTRQFPRHEQGRDPQVATLQRIAQTTLTAIETQTQRQAEIWRHSLEQSHKQWTQLLQSASQAVESSMSGAMRQSMEAHSANLLRIEQQAGATVAAHWNQMQQMAAAQLQELRSQHHDVARQSEILVRVLDATGQIMNLEKTLNQNLRALAGAKNFEDTVMSLSAAIHLLSSRLNKPLPREAVIQLERDVQERAA